MSPTRTVLLAAFAGLLAGCGGATTPPGGTATPRSAVGGGPGTPATPAVTAEATAAGILKAVADGTATPAQLTPAFKAVVAEPVFDSDRAAGYSDAAAADWLKKFVGPKTIVAKPITATDTTAAFALTVDDPKTPQAGGLYLVKANGGWAIDWIQLAPAKAPPATGPGTEYVAGWFALALAAGDDALAEGLLSPKLKASLAPPLFTADAARGYNRGRLRQLFADLRSANKYRVTATTAGPAGGHPLVDAIDLKPN